MARRLTQLILAALCGVAAPAQAASPWQLATDLNSEADMVALGHGAATTPINRRLDLALITYEQSDGDWRYGFEFNHGAMMSADPYDRIGHAEDHTSLTLEREVYVGVSGARRLSGQLGIYAKAGAVQTDLHDGAVAGDPWRLRDLTLTGARMEAGLTRETGLGRLTLSYRLTAFESGAGVALAAPARGHLTLAFVGGL